MHGYFMMFQKRELIEYVFRGEISPSNLIKLKGELKDVIVEEEDFICIIKLISLDVFGEEILGNPKSNGENIFL